MMIVTISFIGYWTAILNNYCLLTFYFIMVILLLISKFGVCAVIFLWPQYLGLNLNSTEMVKVLQEIYGVPGFESYTNAFDFAQTYLDCCGINDSINYDLSLWRLQKMGKKLLTVPLTCCYLVNKFEKKSYLDPIPVNETLCQSIEPQDFQRSRHSEGCIEKVENWYREQYILLLGGGLILVLIDFFVLLSIVLNCSRIKHNQINHRMNAMKLTNNEEISNSERTNSFQRSLARENIYQDDSITTETREIFVQPKNLNEHFSFTKLKGNNYRLSNNSYLI